MSKLLQAARQEKDRQKRLLLFMLGKNPGSAILGLLVKWKNFLEAGNGNVHNRIMAREFCVLLQSEIKAGIKMDDLIPCMAILQGEAYADRTRALIEQTAIHLEKLVPVRTMSLWELRNRIGFKGEDAQLRRMVNEFNFPLKPDRKKRMTQKPLLRVYQKKSGG